MERKFKSGDIVTILGEGRKAKVIDYKEKKDGAIYVIIEWQQGEKTFQAKLPEQALVKVE